MVGSAGISIALGAVARATSVKRSLALGLVVSIAFFRAICGVLPVTQFFINGFGWQMALILLSGVAASIPAARLSYIKEDRLSASTGRPCQAERKRCADHCAWQPRLYFAHYRLFCLWDRLLLAPTRQLYRRDAGLLPSGGQLVSGRG